MGGYKAFILNVLVKIIAFAMWAWFNFRIWLAVRLPYFIVQKWCDGRRKMIPMEWYDQYGRERRLSVTKVCNTQGVDITARFLVIASYTQAASHFSGLGKILPSYWCEREPYAEGCGREVDIKTSEFCADGTAIVLLGQLGFAAHE